MRKFKVNQKLVDNLIYEHVMTSINESHFEQTKSKIYEYLYNRDVITESEYQYLKEDLGYKILTEAPDDFYDAYGREIRNVQGARDAEAIDAYRGSLSPGNIVRNVGGFYGDAARNAVSGTRDLAGQAGNYVSNTASGAYNNTMDYMDDKIRKPIENARTTASDASARGESIRAARSEEARKVAERNALRRQQLGVKAAGPLASAGAYAKELGSAVAAPYHSAVDYVSNKVTPPSEGMDSIVPRALADPQRRAEFSAANIENKRQRKADDNFRHLAASSRVEQSKKDAQVAGVKKWDADNKRAAVDAKVVKNMGGTPDQLRARKSEANKQQMAGNLTGMYGQKKATPATSSLASAPKPFVPQGPAAPAKSTPPSMMAQAKNLGTRAVEKGQQIAGNPMNFARTAADKIGNTAKTYTGMNSSANTVLGRGMDVAKQAGKQAMQDFGKADNTSKAALGLAGGVAALAGVAGAGMLAKNIAQKWSWKKNGCANITDPVKASRCRSVVNKNQAADLRGQMKKCKDDSCRKALMQRIQSLSTK